MRPLRTGALALVTAGLAAGVAACSGSVSFGPSTTDQGGSTSSKVNTKGCVEVDMAVSSEKIALLSDLAQSFNGSKAATVNGRCVFVAVRKVASGAAATLLADDWPDPATNGPKPVVWSPAASAWGAIVNQRLADKGAKAIVPTSKPFMLTPLVIAMPKPMAEALGYPSKPIGFKDIASLATNPQGWAAFGHPEWGPFRLGRTNPNFSTSGLNFTIAQYYAATGKTTGLTAEDLNRPDVDQFARDLESSVVHYGDITGTFLNNWFRADARGTALTYASAVAVEEKSIVDYNQGNPDGVLDPGETPRKPRIPLVAIYPAEGTLYSDNPFIVLEAPWVSAEQKTAAAAFQAYVTTPENQAKVLTSGFRPGNPAVAIGAPISAANGVDPNQPQTLLDVPQPAVMVKVLDKWAQQRKAARVMLVIDVSGSMGDPASDAGDLPTKLDLAKEAARSALDEFKADDQVGLRIFSTGLGGDGKTNFIDLVPIGPISQQREQLAARIDDLSPVQGTPLYDVTATSYADMVKDYDPKLINAIVLLTDGRNDDGNDNDDDNQLRTLVQSLRANSEGGAAKPVRVFPIAYGADADLATLKRIAEASNAAAYDASKPSTINQVFSAVISNF